MLNQTFTVLFESLFINELGQAGEGDVWFKTQPIDEWIATQQNAQQNAQQTANQEAFADTPFYDGVTTFDDNVITGVSVDTLGNVILTTTNGTFYADTTLVPRSPRDKAVIIQDKNGNQWVIQPNGSVISAPGGGLPPKKNEDEDIASMIIGDPAKPYYFRIDTTNIASKRDTTRYFTNGKAYFIQDSTINISVSIHRINDVNFRSDSITWKMKRIHSVLTTNHLLATNIDRCNIRLYNDFTYNVKAYYKGKVIAYFVLIIYKKPVVDFKTLTGFDGEFGFDDGHRFSNNAISLRNDYLSFPIYGKKDPYYASNVFITPNQNISLKINVLGIKAAEKSKNFILKFVRSKPSIKMNNLALDTLYMNYQDIIANPNIGIEVTSVITDSLYRTFETIAVLDYKNKIIGQLRLYCREIQEKKIIFIYVAHQRTKIGSKDIPDYPRITETQILTHLNENSHNQLYIRWMKETRTQLLGQNNQNYAVIDSIDITDLKTTDSFSNETTALNTLRNAYTKLTNSNNASNGGVEFNKYKYSTSTNGQVDFYFITNIPISIAIDDDKTKTGYVAGVHVIGGNNGALFDRGDVRVTAHELGHALNLEHSFKGVKDRDIANANRKIAKATTENYMDYDNNKKMWFLYQLKKLKK